MDLKKYVASIPGFPKEGIIFRDVTPILQNAQAFQEVTQLFAKFGQDVGADVVVGPEARGFLFGCPVATSLNIGFVPVRKPGKLPRETVSKVYTLEYGTNEIQMHKDAIKPGQKVLMVDDLLATGGTIEAAIDLVEEMGGVVVGVAFVIELEDLKARQSLENKGYKVLSLLKY